MTILVKQSVKGKKIFVGLSGGVDSAVTAALLQRAGALVTGVFIKGWYPEGLPCTWAEDRRDAMRVAAHLSIPFHTLDASEEYKKGVIDYLIREYRAGRTPNPDVMCNREVKFGAFYRFAKGHRADFIATGHYARVEDGKLLRGASAAKDQSYFLWAVPKDALAMTLFPLGGMEKGAVRALARAMRLPVAEKKDSQGICFLGPVSMDDFLKAKFGSMPGVALDSEGKEVGTHDGALLSTLGERVALRNAAPGPWYVVRKDIPANVLYVSKKRAIEESRKDVMLEETNLLSPPSEGEVLDAQYRYHGPVVQGTYHRAEKRFIPSEHFPEPVAPGQSLVLYRGEELVGGGIIA